MDETKITTRIYADDSAYEAAKKIYIGFIVGQSCTIEGWEEPGKHKAEVILERLRIMDRDEHMQNVGTRAKPKLGRKYIKPKNSVGGPIANKIFRWDKIGDKYLIWRMQ